jgi:CRP/FNR family transcriptional regulator
MEFNQLTQVYPALLDVPPGLRTSLQLEAKLIQAQADTILFDLGEECLNFVMVLSGSIRVSHPGSRRELLLYHVLPGDSCMMTVSCILGETPYQARGVVERELLAYSLPARLFLELVLQSDTFRLSVFRMFGQRILHLVELVQEVAFDRLDQRLARLLLARSEQLRCTHQDLADDLGTAREVISRYLKEFDTAGLVRLRRGEIHILDRQSLEDIARPD